ncbi:hypothetical protein AAFF_G00217220 [Aldrovandia affinis]|uniref:Uncharacterized protein n=1 Tax=Aldrovandia affinis TaxID=143900 RepID=A0AAD7WUN1_9TELE|nr:hypothetical protein AAFF_G00217220 [Aldrovandia affinis]
MGNRGTPETKREKDSGCASSDDNGEDSGRGKKPVSPRPICGFLRSEAPLPEPKLLIATARAYFRRITKGHTVFVYFTFDPIPLCQRFNCPPILPPTLHIS